MLSGQSSIWIQNTTPTPNTVQINQAGRQLILERNLHIRMQMIGDISSSHPVKNPRIDMISILGNPKMFARLPSRRTISPMTVAQWLAAM